MRWAPDRDALRGRVAVVAGGSAADKYANSLTDAPRATNVWMRVVR
jgi:hypothetical protein